MGKLRDELSEEILLRLGFGLVDVELDPEHVNLSITKAIRYYRQRSTNSMIEAFAFIQVQKDIPSYTLPEEIQEVRAVYRSQIGDVGGGGTSIDPFSQSFINQIYLIQNPGGISTGGPGVMATYDLALGFQKLAGKMFGRDVQYTFDSASKNITFHRKFNNMEEMGLHVYMERPEETLLKDPYSRPWIEDMALSQAKLMLGQGRGKWSAMAGPQGGISLNGDALKQEAAAEIQVLFQELKDGVEAKMGYSFVIG